MKDLNIVLDGQLVGEAQKNLLRIMLISALDDIEKDIYDGEALIESSASSGEPTQLLESYLDEDKKYKHILEAMLEAVEHFDRNETEERHEQCI